MARMYKQDFLPGFPDGAQRIGRFSLSILEKDGVVTYFLGSDNYFRHPKGGKKSERFALTSLIENGHVRARDLEEAPLVIPHRTLMNWKERYRKDGPTSFFRTFDRPKPRVIMLEKIAECAKILAEGVRPAEAARRAGRSEAGTSKSERSRRGCTISHRANLAR